MAQPEPIEEQCLSFYRKKKYFPVRIGDVFQDKYRVITKLGFGAYSTVWLAKDEKTNEYKTLKMTVQTDSTTESGVDTKPWTYPVLNEINMLRRLKKVLADAPPDQEIHPGVDFTRLAEDIFELEGPTGMHHCIVYAAEGISVDALKTSYTEGPLPRSFIKFIVLNLLVSLNWLHVNNLVHTDISPSNVILRPVGDSHIHKRMEDEETENPSIPVITKADDGSISSIIYNSRYPKQYNPIGWPLLADFGKMCQAEDCEHPVWWMSDQYRAPEVLLHLPWTIAVDIWSLGIMTLELVEGRSLFTPVDQVNRQYVLPLAIAQYIGYLGYPPPHMLLKSPHFMEYFSDDGEFTGGTPIPETSLEDFVTTIPPGEEKDAFLRFIRRILTWDPEVRANSFDLLTDEWLQMGSGFE